MNYRARINQSPRDITDLIDTQKGFPKSPRDNKRSFYFGGEHEIPSLTKRRPPLIGRKVREKPASVERQVRLACNKVVKCNIADTYWWPVYSHLDEKNITVFSINSQSERSILTKRSGVIIIKKSDTNKSSIDAVAEKLELELSEYSVWVNSNQLSTAS